MTAGKPCPQEEVHDGLCAVHLTLLELSASVEESIVLLLVEFEGIADKRITAREIMNRIVGPVVDRQVLARVDAAHAEESLRDDFGTLADDLESVRQGEMSDAKKRETLLSWEKTAIVLRDKQLADQLTQPIDGNDFGEVERP
jgi:hypothetical protein